MKYLYGYKSVHQHVGIIYAFFITSTLWIIILTMINNSFTLFFDSDKNGFLNLPSHPLRLDFSITSNDWWKDKDVLYYVTFN